MATQSIPTTAVIKQSMRSVQRMAFGVGLHLIQGKKTGLHYWRLDDSLKAKRLTLSHPHMPGQRREMMQEWADYLDGLRLGEIVYDDPLQGFTPITQKVEIPSPPAAQIEVTPVRPIDFDDFRNRISTRQKNGRQASVHQFSRTKPVSSGLGMSPEVERQPALKGGSHAPDNSWSERVGSSAPTDQ